MKHFFALLLSALMVLSLLTACGDKTTPSDGDDQTVTDENGSDTDNNTDDTTDPYDAVRNYWSEDQLTQAWGPDQVVEHLFFHPIIAYPQWAFHDCNASQDQRYGLDDWMVTVDEYNKILQSVYDKGYILVAMEDVWSEVTDETGETQEQTLVEMYDFSTLPVEALDLNIHIGEASYWSRILQVSTLNNLQTAGVMPNMVEFLSRMPEGSVKDQEGLVEAAKRVQQQASMQQALQQGGLMNG